MSLSDALARGFDQGGGGGDDSLDYLAGAMWFHLVLECLNQGLAEQALDLWDNIIGDPYETHSPHTILKLSEKFGRLPGKLSQKDWDYMFGDDPYTETSQVQCQVCQHVWDILELYTFECPNCGSPDVGLASKEASNG
jgi:hypothetical protein